MDIDKTKELASYIVNVAESLQEKLSDGKFTLMEKLKFLGEQIQLGGIIGNRKEIISEVKDLDHHEAEELINFIVSEYDYNDEKARQIVKELSVIFKSVNNLVLIFKSY